MTASILQRLRQEEERVELTAVPDDGLARRRPEQCEQHDAARSAIARTIRSAAPSNGWPSAFICWNIGDSCELQADVDRDREQHDREQERNAPAPGLEIGAEPLPAEQDHDQRQEEAERRRDLDEARIQAALAGRRVLGDVGRRAAVFAAEREALQQAQRDQDDRRRGTDRRVARAGRRPETSTRP